MNTMLTAENNGSSKVTEDCHSVKKTSSRRPQSPRIPGGVHLGQEASREAKRLAAALLEVLAGTRTPTEAAQALGISAARYYQVERRALQGLLDACEPSPKGRQRSLASELATLRQEVQRLQRELARQQTLVRLSQRTIGLAAPPPPPAKGQGKKIRSRKPVARALQVAKQLQTDDNGSIPAVPTPIAAATP